MSQKKDKQKVLDEVLDAERVHSFLNISPPAGINRDFHVLEKAYRGLTAEYFATFVEFFVKEGHDINAANTEGQTLLTLVKEHRHGKPYAEILEENGAH